ncbi:TPA: hypothetical protein ACO4F2_001611 [Escherichia coli]|uniref:hypothetical protein n=2 Tax=Escherichia coli TaxID=562 RepID=UPI000A513CD2|nr:hypothetical protein [Escherichia coli]EHL3670465.1 hypothetical protein [Escherichia coli]EJD5481592.1 hypothetical protein [Escherichia coli]EJM9807181.1 hypothetical protein [Escherichia coli]EKY0687671.1 hypothetical protein [Escherichia coli]EKY0835780.1 hypothetical protein [Escherichia coli]
MLESLKEYLSSTVNTAAQRVRNPVFGAFALSWCAFNWKSILYLLLSDSSIIDKITYISSNSSWKTVLAFPCVSAIILCGGMPWINNVISKWQAKPLDNYDSIENHRKAKRIHRATRLQRLKAKHDVTYDKVKTGAEKDIQAMKERITESQARMGELTAERDRLSDKVLELNKKLENMQSVAAALKIEAEKSARMLEDREAKINNLIQELKEKEKEGIVLHMGHEPLRKTYTSQAERMIAEAVKNKQ